MKVEPYQYFPGRIVLIAPHMDDEALACGGLIASLPDRELIHLVYATDGMKSPAPIVPSRDSISSDLGEVRVKESIAAMRVLGVPQHNLHFLRLPEARLSRCRPVLAEALRQLMAQLQPDYIFIPFRYDRHRDHLTINHAVMAGKKRGWYRAQLIEYFVYHRWKLLPGRDIRRYIQPQHLIEIDIKPVARQKRMALDCFQSQTTIYYPWQTRPILTSKLLDEECAHPEYFLLNQPTLPGTAVFSRAVLWIRFVHRLEPFLVKWKYLTGALLKRGWQKYGHHAKPA
jgi:N-acetylglucosamine malate deacetylase 1